jgi:UDP-N-acetylglucosamine 1-carboxyvinyltransferase
MGARVRGAGTNTIKVQGVPKLNTVEHQVLPDRIEAGTHMIAASITKGDILVENIIPEHLFPLISKLREAGCEISIRGSRLRISSYRLLGNIDIRTMPYPGFATDLQPQMMALLAVAKGVSVVVENIFENRFRQVDELRRLGADIKAEGRMAVIKGVKNLTGAIVEATDLRAASSLVLAGMVADEVTVIDNVHHLDRGYENLEKKYNDLGARIIRVNNNH